MFFAPNFGFISRKITLQPVKYRSNMLEWWCFRRKLAGTRKEQKVKQQALGSDNYSGFHALPEAWWRMKKRIPDGASFIVNWVSANISASYYQNQNRIKFQIPRIFHHSHTRNLLYIHFILSSTCGCTMFEEMSMSAGQLLLILFSLILLFIIVYGAISLRACRNMRPNWDTPFFHIFLKWKI